MKRIITIAAALSSCILAIAAPRPLATPNVHTDIEGNIFGEVRQVPGISEGGMAVFYSNGLLYCGANSNVYVLDASEPMSPKVIGKTKIVGSVRQLVEKDGWLYVCSRETGAWIIDVHNPRDPKIVTRYDAIELATGIDVAGDVMFLSLRQNGVEFVDITDKANPRHILIQKTSESQSNCYKDGILYSGDWGMAELTVIDAADMSQEKLIKKVKLHGLGDGVYVQGDRLYMSTGHHMRGMEPADGSKPEGLGHALEIFDISDPINPKRLSRIQFDRFYERGNDFWTARPNAEGTTVFCADTYNGLYAVDVASASIVGRITFDVPEGKFPTVSCSSVSLGNGVVYVTSLQYGLAAVACTKASPYRTEQGKLPVNASYRRSYNTDSGSLFRAWRPEEGTQVRSVAAYGDFLYAACSDGGLKILKPGKKGKDVQVVGKGPSKFAGDAKVRGNMLYVAEGFDGLAIYEIGRAGAEIKEVHRITDFGPRCSKMCLWVWIPCDDYIIVTDRNSPYIFLDSETFKPVFNIKGGPGWDRYTCDDLCKGKLLPIVMANNGFAWIDMNGDKPKLLDWNRHDRPGLATSVCTYKGGALTTQKGQLIVLEPGQKQNEDGTLWSGGGKKLNGAPVWNGKDMLCLAHRIGKNVKMMDIRDIEDPQIIWEENMLGYPETPIFWKEKLVVPCGYQGLLIQK